MVQYDSTNTQEAHVLKINIPKDGNHNHAEILTEESWGLTVKTDCGYRSRNFKMLIAILENDVNVDQIEAAMRWDYGEIHVIVPKIHSPAAARSSILMGPRDNWREHRDYYSFRMNVQQYKRADMIITVHKRTFIQVKAGRIRHEKTTLFKGYIDNVFTMQDMINHIRGGVISLIIPLNPPPPKTYIHLGYRIR